MDVYQSKVLEISDLLYKRFSVYPVRDESYIHSNEAIDSLLCHLIDSTDFDDFSPNTDLLDNVSTFSDKPVFICGSMRSGTSMLTQLLDSHPSLVVMPGDSHFVNLLEKWDRRQFAEIASHWLKRVINPTGKEPFWFIGQEEKAFTQFLQYLHYFLQHSRYDIFICVLMANYAADASLSENASKKYWVEKTPHNEIYTSRLSGHFPQAKFIHILRDPLDTIASLKILSRIRHWETTPWQHANSMKRLFNAAMRNQKTLGEDKYHIIAYEDLVSDPHKTLMGICYFLDIPFDENLLVPTENGRLAMSNSVFESSRVSGIILDQSKSKRYLKHLSKEELRDIVTILYDDAVKLGYDWNQSEISNYRRTRFAQTLRKFSEFRRLISHKGMKRLTKLFG